MKELRSSRVDDELDFDTFVQQVVANVETTQAPGSKYPAISAMGPGIATVGSHLYDSAMESRSFSYMFYI